MVISTWSLQRRWQRLQRPIALILLTSGALLLWGRNHAAVPTEPTLVATRDVPAGRSLTSEDLTVADWPASFRPAAALDSPAEVLNRRTVSALSAGEPVTAHRVVTPSALAGSGQVAVLMPDEPLAKAGIVHPGDKVDVVGQTDQGSRTLAAASVLTVTEDAGVLLSVPGDSAPVVMAAIATTSAALVLQSG